MRIAVIGAGYVGLVTGVSLASFGHTVTFVERDAQRRDGLSRGSMPFFEPGLGAAFDQARDRIDVVDSVSKVEAPEFVFVAVATPIDDDGRPDASQLEEVFEALSAFPHLHLSIRSTLPPGMSVRLPELLGRPDGSRLSTNPEFLRQGSALDDFAHPSRIVIGRFPETSADHLALVHTLYAGIITPRLEVDVAAAELIKNAANAFLALKLSFVNEIAQLCEEYGAEVDEVLEGIGLDPRIGSSYMRPGLGFGGSCLPKELAVLAHAGDARGLAMHVALAAARVNREQQARFASRILARLPPRGRVALLGLSFKAGTDDLRGSPAVEVARRLIEAGHVVIAYDPEVSPAAAADAVAGIVTAGSAAAATNDADAIVIATEWPEFGSLDLPAAAGRMRGRLLFDGRNMLEGTVAAAAGFRYQGVGRATLSADRTGSAH